MKTLGSVHALEAVAAENYRKHQDDCIIDIDPSIKPTFCFGSSGRNTCVSTAKLKINAGGQTGVKTKTYRTCAHKHASQLNIPCRRVLTAVTQLPGVLDLTNLVTAAMPTISSMNRAQLLNARRSPRAGRTSTRAVEECRVEGEMGGIGGGEGHWINPTHPPARHRADDLGGSSALRTWD